ncbi:uncharacterized protein LOC133303016 [Gastrolobium bilobum]|uniref:uncharacterized protein LOC133303016 n=1 Tax=Gastrolobium bilobum TaxID=150636 RepID=UPI002AB22C09|nr:uncharacterized protein LOC133303016 [Gastrolobium bilobum]
MKKKIEILWARAGKINVTDVGNGFYVVQFSNKDDLLFALNGGPWIILGHYLSLRRWEPAFRPNAASVMKIAAWVRLPGIPLEYYDEAFFRRIGNWLGKMLKIDKTNNEHVRGQFARICVELDLAQPLKGEYVLDGATKQIEYEGLGLICFHCGRYGHSKDCCPEIPVEGKDNQQNQDGKKDEAEFQKNGLGPWMVVQRQCRSKIQTPMADNRKQEPVRRESRRNQGTTNPDTVINDVNMVGSPVNIDISTSQGSKHRNPRSRPNVELQEHPNRFTLSGITTGHEKENQINGKIVDRGTSNNNTTNLRRQVAIHNRKDIGGKSGGDSMVARSTVADYNKDCYQMEVDKNGQNINGLDHGLSQPKAPDPSRDKGKHIPINHKLNIEVEMISESETQCNDNGMAVDPQSCQITID